MDLHYFKQEDTLVVVSLNAVLFVRPAELTVQDLGEDFVSGLDCSSFSDNGGLVAVSAKRNIAVICVATGKLKRKILLERNCSTLCWNNKGDTLIAGDKSGGLWSICHISASEPKLIGSRVAMILSLLLCGDDTSQFLAVGDRDGRISVFHYPAVHDLHQVCLGHSQYIAALVQPNREKWPNLLLSLGGDGVVCLWNIENGKCVAKTFLLSENDSLVYKQRPRLMTAVKRHDSKSSWLVLCEESTDIYVFSLANDHDRGDFTLHVENVEDVLPKLATSQNIICAVESIVGSELLIVYAEGRQSLWPWKTIAMTAGVNEQQHTFLTFLDSLAKFFQGSNSNGFSLRPSREWLERHPHQSVAEYYARKKKAKTSEDCISREPEASRSDSDESPE